MDFADKIKKVRVKLLISQNELAEELCVSYVTISWLESLKVRLSFLTEKQLENFCKRKRIKIERT